MGLPRPDAGTPVHDYLAQHWSRMVILNWPCPPALTPWLLRGWVIIRMR